MDHFELEEDDDEHDEVDDEESEDESGDAIAGTINSVIREWEPPSEDLGDDQGQLCGPSIDPNIDVSSKDGIVWHIVQASSLTSVRKNISFNERSGITPYAINRIDGSALSAFLLIINNTIIKRIVDSTNAEAVVNQRPDPTFSCEKNDLLAFIAIQLCRGVFCKVQSIKELFSMKYGLPIIRSLMSRDRFQLIMRFLRFDDKTTRSQRVVKDMFAPIRFIWERFIENSSACYKPYQNLTVDEQLLPCKSRCAFIHFMPNKPDKFGIKFWLLCCTLNKYVVKGYPYVPGTDIDKPREDLQLE